MASGMPAPSASSSQMRYHAAPCGTQHAVCAVERARACRQLASSFADGIAPSRAQRLGPIFNLSKIRRQNWQDLQGREGRKRSQAQCASNIVACRPGSARRLAPGALLHGVASQWSPSTPATRNRSSQRAKKHSQARAVSERRLHVASCANFSVAAV